MITIIARKHLRYDAQGNDIARVYISVSSSSELPAQNGIPKIIIAEASKAWDVSTGDKYGFVVGQGWKKQATVINPMTLKGRVNSIEDLPENAEPGWVYFVGDPEADNLPEYMYTEDGKWDPIGTNSIQIDIDATLSTTSENPVQNKVITNAMVGEKTTGKQYVIDGQTVTAGDGAEVFNDYVNNKAAGQYSHAEGGYNTATGMYSHAEGMGNTASGAGAHAEGSGGVRATGTGAHAEGQGNIASGDCAHAEGGGTTASANYSHAEGSGASASGQNSHAEGSGTIASGGSSHAEGGSTIAASSYQHAQGKYNVSDANGTYAFIIGNGTAENARHNAFAIDWSGNIYVNGSATGVNVETLSSTLTPISESAYEALTTKDKPLYFIYD